MTCFSRLPQNLTLLFFSFPFPLWAISIGFWVIAEKNKKKNNLFMVLVQFVLQDKS